MKRNTKYVGLDVHQETTVASVREEHGPVLARLIVPTTEAALSELFRGMRGSVQVAMEEGTQAQWLHQLLPPLVARVVVCDRRGQRRQGNKGDLIDADELSERLRLGGLRAVYQSPPHYGSWTNGYAVACGRMSGSNGVVRVIVGCGLGVWAGSWPGTRRSRPTVRGA